MSETINCEEEPRTGVSDCYIEMEAEQVARQRDERWKKKVAGIETKYQQIYHSHAGVTT